MGVYRAQSRRRFSSQRFRMRYGFALDRFGFSERLVSIPLALGLRPSEIVL